MGVGRSIGSAVAVAPETDTPRRAMGLLEQRVTIGATGLLVVLAAGAWLLTVRQAGAMSGMVSGLAQIGTGMPNEMAAPLFMAMWLTMMVAMMFPTIAPMVLAHRMVVRHRGEGWLPTAVFVLGYLAVWTGIGLLPLMVFLGVRNIETPPSWLPVLSGAILIVAGLYQFTPWKGRCLRACQTPLGFIVTHDFGGGSRSAFSAGIAHGAFCLGCCWGLMAVLVVLGLMNLVWMAAIAMVFLAEKNWRRGLALARVAGAIVTALGIAVVLHPEWLSLISGGSPSPGTGGHM